MGDNVTHEKSKGAFKNVAKTALKIVFAVGLIVWMVKQGALNFGAFAKLSSPALIAFCALSTFAQIFINNYRWLLLLRGQGFKTSVGSTLPLSLIGLFFNFAMPGGVGGDVVKGYYIVQDHPEKKLAAAMSIFMDRLTGFFVMVAMAFLAVFTNFSDVSHSKQLTSIAIGVSILFVCFVTFYGLSLSRVLQAPWAQKVFTKIPAGAKFRRIYDILHSYRQAPRELALAMFLSFASQAMVIAVVAVIGHALGESIPISVYCFLVPLGLVVQALPISPAGIGVGQAAFYFLFNSYLHRASDLGPTAMTVMQLLNFGLGIIGAYFYLHRSRPRPLAVES
ncbi:MAG: lysylphosphatidylglycerol synthase transmembrane domain-containing protein [Bdellovibrionota bacterium]